MHGAAKYQVKLQENPVTVALEQVQSKLCCLDEDLRDGTSCDSNARLAGSKKH